MPCKILSLCEKVQINKDFFLTKIDTGASISSIDKSIAKKLKVKTLKGKARVQQAGKVSLRDVCKLKVKIKGKEFYAWFTISDRKNMKEKILIGQNILKGNFLIKA